MGEYLDQIPENIQEHIREITKTSGLPHQDESVESIAQGWLEKKANFEQEIQKQGMEEVDFLEKGDERASLLMTYSGSLLSIGPASGDTGRKVTYASIGLRKDVPQMAEKAGALLESDIQVDDCVNFKSGPIKSSSPIYKIAVCKENLPAEEQEEKINQATMVLAEEFVDVNKTLLL
jgi:hypothetical protein